MHRRSNVREYCADGAISTLKRSRLVYRGTSCPQRLGTSKLASGHDDRPAESIQASRNARPLCSNGESCWSSITRRMHMCAGQCPRSGHCLRPDTYASHHTPTSRPWSPPVAPRVLHHRPRSFTVSSISWSSVELSRPPGQPLALISASRALLKRSDLAPRLTHALYAHQQSALDIVSPVPAPFALFSLCSRLHSFPLAPIDHLGHLIHHRHWLH
ncbi:hypothetical protein C8Q74DRAFT_401054 [Fomes fomentarius]|nr:hypothetical protein C8Q74DRAFT_401054 [Fomes fomentarius]